MAKVILFSPASVGKTMAGPAIRTWEFAQILSKKHEVAIVSPTPSDIQHHAIRIYSKTDPKWKEQTKTSNVIITQQVPLELAWMAKRHGIKILLDAYTPTSLELLEIYKTHPLYRFRKKFHSDDVARLLFSFQMADRFICASEKQRDLWLGFLLSGGLVTLPRYDQDNSLRKFLDVVPYGLSSKIPTKNGPGLKEKYGFTDRDKIIVWGGGLWDWFDPLSLIKGIKILSQKRSDIKLVFLGVKSPDPIKLSMAEKAMQLSQALGLTDQHVFFNQGWIPYEERHNYLLDATIGASTHFEHLETRFSFRTRILDYMWAQLPILTTEGDSFADLIQRHQLGIVVPYQSEQAIADAITSLVDHPAQLEAMKRNLSLITPNFQWDAVAKPVERMVDELLIEPKASLSYHHCKHMLSYLKERGLAAQTKHIDKLFKRC